MPSSTNAAPMGLPVGRQREFGAFSCVNLTPVDTDSASLELLVSLLVAQLQEKVENKVCVAPARAKLGVMRLPKSLFEWAEN